MIHSSSTKVRDIRCSRVRTGSAGHTRALPALLLLAGACVAQPLSEEEARLLEQDPDAEIGAVPSAILNGVLEYNQRGVVEIIAGGSECTGALLNASQVITAAHCVDQLMDAPSDEISVTVKYFDPDTQSKRVISTQKVWATFIPGWSCYQRANCIDYQDDIAVLNHPCEGEAHHRARGTTRGDPGLAS